MKEFTILLPCLNEAKSLGFVIDDDVASYIATKITANVRQLEGTVKKIKAFHDLEGSAIDRGTVDRAIQDMTASSDFLITSAGGINEHDGWLVDFHDADVSAAQIMMRNSHKVLLALSPGKFGRNAVIRFAPLKNVDRLFTCDPVPERLLELARNAKVTVQLC